MDNTREWYQYQKGLDWKRKISLFSQVDKNERFYSDRQWEGVVSNGLPTPQFNVIKRIIQYKVSSIMADAVGINYFVDGVDDKPEDTEKKEMVETSSIFSKYSETTWERLKMDQSNERILKDGSLSGDGITYYFWNQDINTGSEVMGDIDKEEIDNVNYLPGNPNSTNVQSQPYIILAFRKSVDDLKEEAKKNGIPKTQIDMIAMDTETENQSGDMAKIELDESNKTICLLKLWRDPKTKTVWARKSTQYTLIRNDWDTGLRRYPIAMMNWEERKNCSHGAAEVTGIIPNQIAINKLLAMVIMSVMHTAFPKAIYDKTRIAGWSNLVGTAIGVNGDISGAATYMQPGNLSSEIGSIIDNIITYTKEMAGANETALGEVKPDNTSAIIAIQQASSVPLESIKRRFYQYIEDIALIWVDFWTTYYNVPRQLMVQERGETRLVEYDGSQYREVPFRVKIDVGPSTKWSEVAAIQTLDNLLSNDRITFMEYLERVPDGLIPDKTELIEDRKAQEVDGVLVQKYLEQFVQTLPPETQAQLMEMDDEAMWEQVKQMAAQQAQMEDQDMGMMQPGMPPETMPEQVM